MVPNSATAGYPVALGGSRARCRDVDLRSDYASARSCERRPGRVISSRKGLHVGALERLYGMSCSPFPGSLGGENFLCTTFVGRYSSIYVARRAMWRPVIPNLNKLLKPGACFGRSPALL